jgi:hypothetical protein
MIHNSKEAIGKLIKTSTIILSLLNFIILIAEIHRQTSYVVWAGTQLLEEKIFFYGPVLSFTALISAIISKPFKFKVPLIIFNSILLLASTWHLWEYLKAIT